MDSLAWLAIEGIRTSEEEVSLWGPTQIKFLLILGAVAILGMVVVPRLSGWIFHPKSWSFMYVVLAILAGVAVWQREAMARTLEEKTPFFYGVVGLLVLFFVLIFFAKEKKKADDE